MMRGARRSAGVALGLLLAGCAGKLVERVDPPPAQVAATEAHALGGVWSSLTTFCLAPDGSPIDIRTVIGSGDAALDSLYREAVAQWRYTPTNGAQDRCHTVRFDEDFGPERLPGAKPEATEERVMPLAKLRGQYNPPPPAGAVARAVKEAKVSAWTLVTRIQFCVRRDGEVYDVATLRSSGVEALDRIARATVASWRYAPFPPDEPARCVRSEVRFDFRIP